MKEVKLYELKKGEMFIFICRNIATGNYKWVAEMLDDDGGSILEGMMTIVYYSLFNSDDGYTPHYLGQKYTENFKKSNWTDEKDWKVMKLQTEKELSKYKKLMLAFELNNNLKTKETK